MTISRLTGQIVIPAVAFMRFQHENNHTDTLFNMPVNSDPKNGAEIYNQSTTDNTRFSVVL